MENKTNQCFNKDESDELTKLKILNSALIKELRKYKEENTKLKHENEILNSIIENLEEENKAFKSDFSSMKNQHPYEESMNIVENMLQSNHEIKEEQLDYYDDDTNNEPNNDKMKLAGIQSLHDTFKFVHESHKDDGLNEYKSFPDGGKLKKHTVHVGHKDYKCESCSKSQTGRILDGANPGWVLTSWGRY